MSSKYEMYDSAFLGILQNEGNIVGFLDAFFAFLYRRTDFYQIMNSPTDKMGFPPGVARKHVLAAFRQYEILSRKHEEEQLQKKMQQQQHSAVTENSSDVANIVQQVVRVEEVSAAQNSIAASDNVASDNIDSQSTNDRTTDTLVGHSVSEQTESPSTATAISLDSHSADSDRLVSNLDDTRRTTSQSVQIAATSGDEKKNADDDDIDDAQLTLQQKQFQLNAESYNGAMRDSYSWSQSISDVDIRVTVPRNVRRGADVKIEISRKQLRVAIRQTDDGGSFIDVMNGELTWDIHKDESMWSLVPGEHIHINLEKVQERWWEAVLVDEPKISVRKIDPSRPMTDLDDESQAKIEELLHNEHQKRLGLPQSHEQKVQDILRQAWDVEGSPFKGQPFDPSVVNVTPGSS